MLPELTSHHFGCFRFDEQCMLMFGTSLVPPAAPSTLLQRQQLNATNRVVLFRSRAPLSRSSFAELTGRGYTTEDAAAMAFRHAAGVGAPPPPAFAPACAPRRPVPPLSSSRLRLRIAASTPTSRVTPPLTAAFPALFAQLLSASARHCGRSGGVRGALPRHGRSRATPGGHRGHFREPGRAQHQVRGRGRTRELGKLGNPRTRLSTKRGFVSLLELTCGPFAPPIRPIHPPLYPTASTRHGPPHPPRS